MTTQLEEIAKRGHSERTVHNALSFVVRSLSLAPEPPEGFPINADFLSRKMLKVKSKSLWWAAVATWTATALWCITNESGVHRKTERQREGGREGAHRCLPPRVKA